MLKFEVKLGPWLQFVGGQLATGFLLLFCATHGSRVARAGAFLALAVGVGSFLHSVLGALKFHLPVLLQAAGYAVLLAGLLLAGAHPALGVVACYLGLGVAQAGFAYNLIYP